MGSQERQTAAGGSKSLILYCRLSGLLAHAAMRGRPAAEGSSPICVYKGRFVVDSCGQAQARGIRVGMPMMQARRLSPTALIIPEEEVDARRQATEFLDRLADLSPIVEPTASHIAFADVSGESPKDVAGWLTSWAASAFRQAPVLGFGVSRIAACACGECGLPPERLEDADVSFLWPEDVHVPARLKRLGLTTFGQVAEMPEPVLVHHFGRIGRLLHRRARGIDLTPVRSLYPPPRADVRLDTSEFPIGDVARLEAVLAQAAARAAQDLRHAGRYGRRVVLRLETERGEEVYRERILPVPVQGEEEVLRGARYLLRQVNLAAPVSSVRLLIEDTEIPAVQTPSLFADKVRDSKTAIRVLRRVLCTRFGNKALQPLSELPAPLRDERRALIREELTMRR